MRKIDGTDSQYPAKGHYILCPILYCQNNHNTYFGQLFEDCTYNKPPGENQRLSLYCGINGTWWLML